MYTITTPVLKKDDIGRITLAPGMLYSMSIQCATKARPDRVFLYAPRRKIKVVSILQALRKRETCNAADILAYLQKYGVNIPVYHHKAPVFGGGLITSAFSLEWTYGEDKPNACAYETTFSEDDPL